MTRIERLATAAAALSIGAFLVVEVYDLDVFWNVAIGRDILATRSIPRIDRYTVAGMGHPYQDIHWLFQVAAALAHAVSGWAGVELLTAALWAAAFVCVWRAAARFAPPSVTAVLVFLAAMACVERFLPRPELVTVAALAFVHERLLAGRFRSTRDVAVLAVTQVVWANAHGLFVLGPFLAGSALAGALVERRREDARALARLVGVLAAASFLTPHGWRTWSYAWLLVTQVGPDASLLMKSLGELSPTFGSAFRSSPAFWFYVALLATTGLLLAAGVKRRVVPLGQLLALLGVLAASFTGRRNVVLFAIVAAPFCAELLGRALPGLATRLSRPLPDALAALAMLGWSVYPLSGRYYLHMEIPARFGLGLTPSFFPRGLPRYLDAIGFEGHVYNSNTIGGFYLNEGFPRRLPLSEGRWTAYDEGDIAEILKAPSDAFLFRKIVGRYAIEALLLAHSSFEARALLPRLRGDPAWRLVWYDYAASLWLRNDRWSRVPAVDLPRGLTLAPPARVDDALILDQFFLHLGPSALRPRIENLRRAIAFSWRRAENLERLGEAQIAAQLLPDAEATFRTLLLERPSSVRARNELAFFAFTRGDAAGAERLLVDALRIDPGNAETAANLRRVRGGR